MLSPAGIDGWFAEEDVTPTPACRGVDVQPRACSARRDATDSQRRARANGSHRGSFKVRGGYIRPLLRPASGTVSIRPAAGPGATDHDSGRSGTSLRDSHGLRAPGLSATCQQQCFELLQAARLHVIPIRNTDTASGQVTLVESMSHKRPTIVTRCLATVDYAVDREEVRFVPQGDVAALTDAIAELWGDESLRARMSERAFERARREFSDEAIGKVLQEVLDGVT
jgi:glycosyltransferase involved in cell wall biosynthesis